MSHHYASICCNIIANVMTTYYRQSLKDALSLWISLLNITQLYVINFQQTWLFYWETRLNVIGGFSDVMIAQSYSYNAWRYKYIGLYTLFYALLYDAQFYPYMPVLTWKVWVGTLIIIIGGFSNNPIAPSEPLLDLLTTYKCNTEHYWVQWLIDFSL